MATNQNMFERTFGYSKAHSTSDSERLQSAYPASPIHSQQSEEIGEFTREKVKQWYIDNVLTGQYPEGSDFNESDYDYVAVPESIPLKPEDEAIPGQDGSTIVSSGLGPNVATHDRSDLSASPMIDASPQGSPPFEGDGSASPKSTTDKISNQQPGTLESGNSGGSN